MATRHYTEEAYEQIKRTIEEIDNTDVNPVADFLGDIFQRIGQFLEIYKLEDYQNDFQKWYDNVLDSHDTTMNAVDSIFSAVDSVDFEYRDIMDGVHTSIVAFQGTLNTLRDVISGKISLSEGKKAAEGYLSFGKNALNGSFNTLLTKMEQGTLWDASLALVGDAIKLGAGYLKCKAGGNAADYKNFVDTCLATVCDLRAMGTILVTVPVGIVGAYFGMSYDDYLDFRFRQLTKARELKDTNSISDLLENLAEDMDEQVAACPKDNPLYPVVAAIAEIAQANAAVAKVIDLAVDIYGIGKDLKDTHDMIYGQSYTAKEYANAFAEKDYWNILECTESETGVIIRAKGSPGEMITEIVSDRIGLPLSGWTDPSKFDGNVLKTAGTLWSYGEKLLPNPVDGHSNISDIPDVAFSKFKDTKFLKDIFDLVRDLDDLVHSDPTENATSGGTGDNLYIGRVPLPGGAK